jgi:hypothetical protein
MGKTKNKLTPCQNELRVSREIKIPYQTCVQVILLCLSLRTQNILSLLDSVITICVFIYGVHTISHRFDNIMQRKINNMDLISSAFSLLWLWCQFLILCEILTSILQVEISLILITRLEISKEFLSFKFYFISAVKNLSKIWNFNSSFNLRFFQEFRREKLFEYKI